MNIIKLNAIDSTNTYLKQLVRETSVKDETVVIAEKQMKGRGQMGSEWASKEGLGLTFSVFKEFSNLLAERQFVISMIISVGIAEALKTYQIPNITIKWPNDIMADNKKIGGVLIENVLEGQFVKHSVIGIGINVNEMSFEGLPQAGSLKLATGRDFQKEGVFNSILKGILDFLGKFSMEYYAEIKQRYECYLFQKGIISVFERPGGNRFKGVIRGVSNRGELQIENEKAQLESFQLKEVKMIY